LSSEIGTPITPGFEALVFKASRGIEDIYELTYIRKDGSRFPAVVSVTALRDAQDAIIGYLLIGTDNTARKQVEAEQKQLAQRLRDHQFYTRSLFESNIDALVTTDPSGIITDVNKQMEAVGTLAGGIAHDFNNVLTVILGFGELLKLRKLLRKVVREDIRIRTTLAEKVPTIRADQGQVEQVLINLALNARDAMPGGGQLLVETQEEWIDEEYVKQYPYMKPGRYAVLSVSDTGIGMDEGTRDRIFEPFFTTKGPDKGTGLGLAVVYGVVKQHNGFIHIYSEPGKGTTFRIYFPAVDVPPDSKSVVARPVIRGGSETVLLAEDNESVRHLAEQTLIAHGYRVLSACDGEEAVDIFRRHGKEIAIVVLDMVMPNMGGKQAYDEMIATNPGLKAIFMSGYSPNAIHDSFVLHPGVTFLQKPFPPGILLKTVREVLDNA